MEANNIPIVAKKFWRMVRVVFFMLRKGISKGKLMIDLNMMMKRGKIAGKALQNLMFHHSHNWVASAAAHHRRSHHNHNHNHVEGPPNEYEFSCSNSPANNNFPNFHLPFHLSSSNSHNNNNKRKNNMNLFSSCAHVRHQTQDLEFDDNFTVQAVLKALEMMQSQAPSPSPSPALPGFGKSPMVRQLRITDSPFPLRDVDEDSHVDEAAEKFIQKFYKDLRLQNAMTN